MLTRNEGREGEGGREEEEISHLFKKERKLTTKLVNAQTNTAAATGLY